AQCDRGHPHSDFRRRHCVGNGEILRVDFEQDQVPVFVLGNDLGSMFGLVGQCHHHTARIVREIERTRDDPAVAADNNSGGRSGGAHPAAQPFCPASGLDLDNAPGDLLDGFVNVVVLSPGLAGHRQRRSQDEQTSYWHGNRVSKHLRTPGAELWAYWLSGGGTSSVTRSSPRRTTGVTGLSAGARCMAAFRSRSDWISSLPMNRIKSSGMTPAS